MSLLTDTSQRCRNACLCVHVCMRRLETKSNNSTFHPLNLMSATFFSPIVQLKRRLSAKQGWPVRVQATIYLFYTASVHPSIFHHFRPLLRPSEGSLQSLFTASHASSCDLELFRYDLGVNQPEWFRLLLCSIWMFYLTGQIEESLPRSVCACRVPNLWGGSL